MEFDAIAQVDAKELFSMTPDGQKNLLFCYNTALMVGNTPASKRFFLFALPQDEERWAMFEKLVFEGASLPFLERVREARQQGAVYILFFV